MRPRVLILTGEPPESPGGMEQVIREMAKGLEGRGYLVEVLHRQNSAEGWVQRPAKKWQAYTADAVLSLRLGRRVSERMGEDVVAVFSNGPFGWYLPRVPARVQKLHFYHGTYRGQASGIRPFISRLSFWKLKWWDSMVLERWSGRGKEILCNSDQTRTEVSSFFGYEGKTVWLPLDLGRFRPLDKMESRRGLGLQEGKSFGLFVGSTQPTKGFPVVRSLISALPEVHWLLALRGEVPKDLGGNSRVTVFQNVSTEVLPRLYSAADFSLSASYYEAFGYAIAEALACGVPVVASRGGASRFFLSGSPLSGFLVPRPDAFDDYLACVRAILMDPEYYRHVVVSVIRPKVEAAMSPENWWRSFFEITGL